MSKFSQERRSRWVMFLGLGILAALQILGNQIGEALDYQRWLQEDGWMHAFAAILVLIGAWKWCNAREDARNED